MSWFSGGPVNNIQAPSGGIWCALRAILGDWGGSIDPPNACGAATDGVRWS